MPQIPSAPTTLVEPNSGVITSQTQYWFNNLKLTINSLSSNYAPLTSTYITRLQDTTLPNSFYTAQLATGFVKVTSGTGTLSSTGHAYITASDIDPTYIGQTSITTLGTIVAGTWNGAAINTAYITGTYSITNITGDMTGTSSSAGKIAEYVESNILQASGSTFTTNTLTNLTSLSLTAGKWLVTGSIGITGGAVTSVQAGISTTSAVLPDMSRAVQVSPLATSTIEALTVPSYFSNSSGSVTVYLVFKASATATNAAFGTLSALRVG